MSLYQTLHPTPDCTVLLWKIEENESQLGSLATLTSDERAEFDLITHPIQRVEWLACRVVMRRLVTGSGLNYGGLYKDEYGKPHLVGLEAHVSISHTTGWAAAALHRLRPVGIDLEPFRPQLTRVVPRVLSDAENDHAGGDLTRLAMYWCAKEALYKLYGKRQLSLREHLIIEPFADGARQLTGHVRLPGYVQELAIYCFWTGPGLLVTACSNDYLLV